MMLVMALVFGLCACGGAPNSGGTDVNTAPAPSPQQSEAPSENEETEPVESVLNAAVTFSVQGVDFHFDPTKSPNNTQDIVVVSGSWHDMGVQFGQQAWDAIERCIAEGMSSVLASRGSLSAAYSEEALYTATYADVFPQMKELLDGIAEGCGHSFEEVCLAYYDFTPEAPIEDSHECSHVAAWGNATENGDMLVAFNADTSWSAENYLPAVVAFPSDGNAFISSMGFYGTLLNDKGVVVEYSAGQGANPDDYGVSCPTITNMLYSGAYANTAAEARDYCIKFQRGRAANTLCADSTGDAYLIEATFAHYQVRQSGDFDETDYLIMNNHFLTEEMQSSLYTDDSYIDCPYRYATVEQIVKENMGNISINTLREAEASTRYYDYNTGEWVYSWSLADSLWSPENKDAMFKAVMRQLINANTKTYYFLKGCQQTDISLQAEATGAFWKITLADNAGSVTASAKNALMMELWYAAKDLDGVEDNLRRENLNIAKNLMDEGNSYTTMAELAEGSLSNEYYGKALTAYCKGQCYAKLAQNDPAIVNESLSST